MKNKKISYFLIIALILFLLIPVTGCQQTTAKIDGPTKTITDCMHHEVVIPDDPQRVACLYASTAHIMTMLGQESKIVGVPNGIKRDVLMSTKIPDLQNLSVPFHSGSINVEELLAIHTDLVLLRYNTAQNKGEVEKLDKAGIPWVVVDYLNLEELSQAIRVSGTIFNVSEKAEAYNTYLTDTLNLVSTRVNTIPTTSRIRIYHAVNEAARTDLNGDICSQISDTAGVINVATQGGTLITDAEKTMTTLEQIYSWNPDAIIANDLNTTNYILTDSKWTGLQSVKNKNVTTLPIGITRWDHPGSMEPHMATLFIAMHFYPDLFLDIDLKQEVKNYYATFFNLDLDDASIASILSGNGMRLSK
jgi:iron complex transport system substrate-binding protein